MADLFPAGYYDDPSGEPRERYWSGDRWGLTYRVAAGQPATNRAGEVVGKGPSTVPKRKETPPPDPAANGPMGGAGPAGWYQDPTGIDRQRYWTGFEWGHIFRAHAGAPATRMDGSAIRAATPSQEMTAPAVTHSARVRRNTDGLQAIVIIAGLILLAGWGCVAIMHKAGADHSTDAEANCEATISAKAAPVSINFGGLLSAPPSSHKDGDGYDVSGTASATVAGTKITFVYSCTTDADGNVLTTDSDLPS